MSVEQRRITITHGQRRFTVTRIDGGWRAWSESDGRAGSGETAGAAVKSLADTYADTDADARSNEIVEQALGAFIEARLGEAVEQTFEALDDAAEGETGDRDDVDPDAPLFAGEPIMSVDMANESINDVLYGPIEADDASVESSNGA